MQKFLLSLAFIVYSLISNAQNDYYGSKGGGFALTFGADPVINFVGNMFNGTVRQKFSGFKGLGSELFNGATITGKYMLKDNQAAILSFGFNNEADKINLYDNGYAKDNTGSFTRGSKNFILMAGYQYLLRPGNRLQPILGVNLVYSYLNFQYARNENLVLHNTRYEGLPFHTLGVITNIGVEYFIVKNISLSATVDFGVCKTWARQSHSDSKNSLEGYSTITNTHYLLKTGQFGENLGITFYF